jgi:hypothetical protein
LFQVNELPFPWVLESSEWAEAAAAALEEAEVNKVNN